MLLATILLLCDVFNAIQPLNLVLQKGCGSLYRADISMYLEKILNCLDERKTTSYSNSFHQEKHDALFETASAEILNLSPDAGTRLHLAFSLTGFEEAVFVLFLNDFMDEVKETFTRIDFWLPFIVFHPRR